METHLAETHGVSKMAFGHSGDWVHRLSTLLDAAVVQLHHRENAAHSTLLEAASLLKEQLVPQGEVLDAVKSQVPAVYGGGLPRYRLKRVIDYIDKNLSGDLTLAQLAAVAGMSPHYFAELFRRSTGRSPHQYVLVRRINLAKDRLRDRRCSVIEAGLDAGFQNPSHFARVFRKWVGISPSGFRSEELRSAEQT